MSKPRSALPGFAIAIAVLIAGLLLALTIGRYPVGLGDLLNVLFSKALGVRADVPPAVESAPVHTITDATGTAFIPG